MLVGIAGGMDGGNQGSINQRCWVDGCEFGVRGGGSAVGVVMFVVGPSGSMPQLGVV